MNIESVAVFCGSHLGNNPVYGEHVKELGKLLCMLKIKIVYGGGHKGLMGVLADSVLEQDGLSLVVTVNAAGGLDVSPDLPHAVQACANPLTLSQADLTALQADARLVALAAKP